MTFDAAARSADNGGAFDARALETGRFFMPYAPPRPCVGEWG